MFNSLLTIWSNSPAISLAIWMAIAIVVMYLGRDQAHQVFRNLGAVCEAAGGSLQDMVKVNIFLTDLANFATVNQIMAQYFNEPYPARAAIGVNQLPRDAQIEIDGIMVL